MPSRSPLWLVSPFLAAALAQACTPTAPQPARSHAPPEPERAPTVLAVTAPGSESLELRATAIECSWGSSGVMAADAPTPYWVIAVVELQAEHDVTGLALTELELFDADARSLGRADRELELRTTSADATAFTGTDADTPFDGMLTAGRPIRLRIRARMDDAFADRLSTPPTSYRATLRSDAGAILRISGSVGSQWPTG
jgi:hypothetical protein